MEDKYGQVQTDISVQEVKKEINKENIQLHTENASMRKHITNLTLELETISTLNEFLLQHLEVIKTSLKCIDLLLKEGNTNGQTIKPR